MAENVKVAVRVRPFNDREKKRNANLVISMNGQTTAIKDPENIKAEPKKFAFDYSYWSHDGFTEKPDGYLEPADSRYADQNKVFNDLGKGVLENAWKGYNTSLFAYGQTGSGKSYSMVGYGSNRGIVPMACNDLFEKIEVRRKDAKEGDEFKVQFSMMEIYNEQARDLLNPKSLKLKGGMKIRQHQSQGFYVEGLTLVPVNSYNEINAKINEGTQNRTVASTNMNATSSRAHTIVAIKFTQKSSASGQSMTKTSLINLVDLAGSERADSTGATGDRLKEGSAINQSLSTLGNVIKALADQSMGNKKVVVPYRDSVLTKLLKNALGGNSKTVMIAALSPADINYEETLSTLRFADRAKAIKTTAVVNESPTDKLIRELREENQRLMDMLKGGATPVASGGATGISAEEREEMARMEAELQKNQEEMEEMKKNWEEQMKEQKAQMEAEMAAQLKENEQKKSTPHMWNLNEDPSLSGKVSHFVNKGKVILGSVKNEKANIHLAGLGIQNEHVTINNKNDEKITLKPNKGAKVVLNGNEITGEKELHHNDRILFGQGNNLFVFHHPKDFAKQQKNKKVSPVPTFEAAQEEIAEHSGLKQLTSGGKTKEDLLLQEDLIHLWPMINEANAMSEELDKKDKFEIVLIAPQARGKTDGRTEVCVKMTNLKNGTEFIWSKNNFIDRKYRMQEMYQNYIDGDKDWDCSEPEADPFFNEPSEPVLIGSVHVYLQSLGYLIELEESLKITDYKGKEQGVLNVCIFPVRKDGSRMEDDFVDDPNELLGKYLGVDIQINNARGLPNKFVKTFCQYKFYLEENFTKTAEVGGMNPNYDYKTQLNFNPVTKQLVDYLTNDVLLVEVWGRQVDEVNSNNSGLTTEELMKKDKTLISGGVKTDHHYKMAAEANTYKKRMERAEAKLRKIRGLVEKAQKDKKDTIKVSDVNNALRSGSRLKAVATVVLNMRKANMNQASQSCSLQ